MLWIIIIAIVILIIYRIKKEHDEYVDTHLTQFGGMKEKYALLITVLELHGFKIRWSRKDIIELASSSSICTLAYIGDNLEVNLVQNSLVLGHTKKRWIFPDGYPQEKMIEEMQNYAIWQLEQIAKYSEDDLDKFSKE